MNHKERTVWGGESLLDRGHSIQKVVEVGVQSTAGPPRSRNESQG